MDEEDANMALYPGDHFGSVARHYNEDWGGTQPPPPDASLTLGEEQPTLNSVDSDDEFFPDDSDLAEIEAEAAGLLNSEELDALDLDAVEEGVLSMSAEEEPSDPWANLSAETRRTYEEILAKYPETPARAYMLEDLLKLSRVTPGPGSALEGAEGVEVLGLADDSRQVQSGDLFFCIRGSRNDGHDFAGDAYNAGAAAIVSEVEMPDIAATGDCPVILVSDTRQALHRVANAFYDYPSRRMAGLLDEDGNQLVGGGVIGVTGTNGKTTTSWLIRGMLEETGQLVGMVGTVEYALAEDRLDPDGEIWVPKEEDPTRERDCTAPYRLAPYVGKYSVPNTTPDELRAQRLLAGMADRGATAAVYECSSIGLDQGRCDGILFSVAVHTNVTQDHLDYHGDMEAYKQAKLRLFRSLRDPERQRAVINLDDPNADEFIFACSEGGVPYVTYAITDIKADVRPSQAGRKGSQAIKGVKQSLYETEIEVELPPLVADSDERESIKIITPLIGKANIYNVLAAVATGIALRVPLPQIVAGIEAVDVVPGRTELIDEGQMFPVIVDYAHTPDALSRLLDTVRECGAKRIITVVGCGGDRDRSKRPYMGEIAHYKSDLLILTNDNPRTESPSEIIADIVAGFPDDILGRHQGSVYPWLQDPIHTPMWFEEFIMKYQGEVKRYVIEDRFTAIRAAIGTAQPRDVVVIAGKGHEDYIEHGDGKGGIVRGWFDDRVEARNALVKLSELEQITYLDRSTIPWRNTKYDKGGDV
ncbi:unnamed protein product [Pedinophyceae sp. YPF-701]|nr:unnamed protein product [Pedinophyceae sp. YPF-701]